MMDPGNRSGACEAAADVIRGVRARSPCFHASTVARTCIDGIDLDQAVMNGMAFVPRRLRCKTVAWLPRPCRELTPIRQTLSRGGATPLRAGTIGGPPIPGGRDNEMAGETGRQGIRAISLQLVGLLAVPWLALTGSPTGFRGGGDGAGTRRQPLAGADFFVSQCDASLSVPFPYSSIAARYRLDTGGLSACGRKRDYQIYFLSSRTPFRTPPW